jgi:hypothetical protein
MHSLLKVYIEGQLTVDLVQVSIPGLWLAISTEAGDSPVLEAATF